MTTTARRKPTYKKNTKQLTKVIYVLDASGSIAQQWLTNSVIRLTNNLLEQNKEIAKKEKQETTASIITFDYPNNINYIYENVLIQKARPIDSRDYQPLGSTALFDAVGVAINDGLADPSSRDKDTAFLLVVITDGQENSSVVYPKENVDRLNKLINKAQNKGNWTITFQVPRSYANYLVSLGISRDNIREWDQTERGIKEVERSTSEGLTRYYNDRTRGLRSSSNFYMETDLSDLNSKKLKRDLIDLSEEYGIFTTPHEIEIRGFVELMTNEVYEKGQAFYQLSKTEIIQPRKEILIFDKNTTAIYGGKEARDLIGLPSNINAKVHPGDHSHYEIFVQSTSVNRKLAKGTKVAIKMN
jgi:hypothetical protein